MRKGPRFQPKTDRDFEKERREKHWELAPTSVVACLPSHPGKLLKFLFDLPLLEHHNIRPFWVNLLNAESIIFDPFPYVTTEWKKSNETRDGY